MPTSQPVTGLMSKQARSMLHFHLELQAASEVCIFYAFLVCAPFGRRGRLPGSILCGITQRRQWTPSVRDRLALNDTK